MKQYNDLLRKVLDKGTWHHNRTGIPTLRITGAMLEFDLAEDGFPAVTTKQLAWKAVRAELIGFIRGVSSAKSFRFLGCKIWDQNANENKVWLANPNRKGMDDLGRIYGVQWRNWIRPSRWFGSFFTQLFPSRYKVDQLALAISDIQTNHESRRIIVNAWNPAELNQMALPPCHIMFQLHVDKDRNELSMTMYQRSCDMFLGVPFNIASYALLLEMIAAATNYKAKKLVMFLADVHIYENHFRQVREQLEREPLPLPELQIEGDFFSRTAGIERLNWATPGMFNLLDYNHHPAIKADMAV